MLDANFGRTLLRVCAGVGAPNTETHWKAETFEAVAKACNTLASCTVPVSDAALGPSCGAPSYLTVTYSCLVAEQACEHIYFRGDVPMTHSDAQRYCRAMNGRLAVPNTEA